MTFQDFTSAIRKNNLQDLELFFKRGYVNKKIDSKLTPLLLAISYAKLPVIEFLINNGAHVNGHFKGYDTPLIEAFIRGKIEIVKLLLDARADPNIRGRNGKTILMYAVEKNNYEIVKLLLDIGATPNIQDDLGRTAIMYNTKGRGVEIFKLLLDAGANVNISETDGNTVLMHVIKNGNNEKLKLLLERNVNVNISNIYGMTPLSEAIISSNYEAVELLLEHGAEADLRSDRLPLGQSLINFQGSYREDLGSSLKPSAPVVLAINRRNDKILKLLLEHDPNLDLRKNGKTILDMAKESEDIMIMSLVDYFYYLKPVLDFKDEKLNVPRYHRDLLEKYSKKWSEICSNPYVEINPFYIAEIAKLMGLRERSAEHLCEEVSRILSAALRPFEDQ